MYATPKAVYCFAYCSRVCVINVWGYTVILPLFL